MTTPRSIEDILADHAALQAEAAASAPAAAAALFNSDEYKALVARASQLHQLMTGAAKQQIGNFVSVATNVPKLLATQAPAPQAAPPVQPPPPAPAE